MSHIHTLALVGFVQNAHGMESWMRLPLESESSTKESSPACQMNELYSHKLLGIPFKSINVQFFELLSFTS